MVMTQGVAPWERVCLPLNSEILNIEKCVCVCVYMQASKRKEGGREREGGEERRGERRVFILLLRQGFSLLGGGHFLAGLTTCKELSVSPRMGVTKVYRDPLSLGH